MRHPIVVQTAPSEEQWPAILARGCDVAVTAGAGTGKTRTLVARYLSLLAEDLGLPLRAIVAITFTRKAAREMRHRVRNEMRRYLARPDLDDAERQRWQQRYGDLDAARIGTIHSLCAEILRAHPAEARVDPRFEMLAEGQVNILRGRAVTEALTWVADDEQAVRLFSLLGERGLHGTLDDLLKQRLEAQEAWAGPSIDPLARWERDLIERQEQALATLRARPDWIDAVATLQAHRPTDPGDRMAVQRQSALAAIRDATGSLADRLAALAHLGTIDLTGGSGRAWPGGRDELAAVKDALRTLRDCWRAQSRLLEMTLTPLDEALAQALPALQRAFTHADRRYAALKHERNALDFDDLEHGALMILRRHPAVRRRWQEEIQAILVDEFQDTNARQRDLVTLLNGGAGKLFIVGDAKQSIYRFRGADVTVFRDERARIARRGCAYDLDISYRAHRDLVTALNDLLRSVLGDADPARPWVEPLTPLRPRRAEPGDGLGPTAIELHLTVGSKQDGALDRAADALVARLVSLVESGARVVVDGRDRPMGYGDVAILCRASTSFGAYEDALERSGVPFLTVAGRGFYDRPEIRDLLNALQALADPTDDLALAGLLRSPACGLSDAALYRLCRARDRAEAPTTLWDVLREVHLPGEDGRRADQAVQLVVDLHGQVGRSPVADVLKAFLDATHYRAALIQAGHTRGTSPSRAARNVAKLLADAHPQGPTGTGGIVGVGEFLEYVRGLRDVGAREGEARATAENVVQVMSVHAAKGLEFPIVAIGDATYRSPGRHEVLVDPDLGLLLPLTDEDKTLPAAYCLGQMRAADQESAEMDRLLYVAATRASEKLVVSGCMDLKRNGTPSLRGWLGQIASSECLGLAGECIAHDADGARAIHLDLRSGETLVACTVYEPGYVCASATRAIPEETTSEVSLPPPWLAPVSPGKEDVDQRTREQDRLPPQRVWRVVPAVERPRAPAWVVGSLVHEALAAWRFPDARFERWATARSRGYGVTDARQLADAVRRSREILLRFRQHSLYREMDGADQRLHEVPYSLAVREGGEHVESGIIDALYRQGDCWTLVEFKTDQVRDLADLETLLEEQKYRVQARRYVTAVERLLGQRPRLILCLLNYAGAIRLETGLAMPG